MKVRAKRDLRYGGDRLEKGEVYDLPDSTAREAIEKGLAEKADETKEGKDVWRDLEKKLDEEPAKQGIRWLKADHVDEGDEIAITGPGEWNDDFAHGDDDKPDLVLPVEVGGRVFRWRLNKTQMRKMADSFGNKTGNWVGESVVVDEIVDYPNLGTRGFKVIPITEGE